MCAAPPQLVADQRDQNKLLISARLAKKNQPLCVGGSTNEGASARVNNERQRRVLLKEVSKTHPRTWLWNIQTLPGTRCPAHDYYSNKADKNSERRLHQTFICHRAINYATCSSADLCLTFVASDASICTLCADTLSRRLDFTTAGARTQLIGPNFVSPHAFASPLCVRSFVDSADSLLRVDGLLDFARYQSS